MPTPLTPISAYVLTHNSEKHLADILNCLSQCTDEICVIDSGSADNTLAIATQHHAKIVSRPFSNFREQRNFALQQCQYDWVLSLDSDEIPDQHFINSLNRLRHAHAPNAKTAFQIRRKWNVLGRNVHAIYPVSRVPDFPVRLFNRQHVDYANHYSKRVHENPTGFDHLTTLPGEIQHITFATTAELDQKIALYTDLAAQDLYDKRQTTAPLLQHLHGIAAFLKSYLIRRGYLDGRVGLRLASYAYQYTYQKYRKAHQLRHNKPT